MTRAEQHSMVELLKEYMHQMRGRDLDEFDVIRKRDRDDEDLDQLTRRRLTELYVKYVPERFRR
jgi:hypothetical protein